MIAFGFSNNFYVAIALRFIWGVADGYLGICKTVLSEICSEDMLPITTGLMFISAALSRLFFVYLFYYSVLGPIVGGYLSDPETLLSGLIKRWPFLERVPFAIPLLICGLLSIICIDDHAISCLGALMTYLWVDETLPEEDIKKLKESKKEDVG